MGEDGAKYWRSDMAGDLEATEKAGKVVRHKIPGA